MEYNINNQHIISDKEIVEERFSKIGIYDVDFDKIADFVNSEENTIFYFDMCLNLKQMNEKDTFYAWVDSGYQYMGEPLASELQ